MDLSFAGQSQNSIPFDSVIISIVCSFRKRKRFLDIFRNESESNHLDINTKVQSESKR